MEYLNDPRIKYLLYRCFKCGYLFSAFQLKRRWDSAPPNPDPGNAKGDCAASVPAVA
jgi:hypothetical protein